MAPHSSTVAWKIPWMEEPGRLQSMGSLRVRHDWATSLSLLCIGERNGNPLQCSCLENPRDGGAWWAAIYGVAQSWTRLKWLSSSSSIYMESKKMVMRNLSAGQQWRCRHREETCGHNRGWRGGTNWESSVETYTLPYVTLDSQWKFAIWHKELKSYTLWQPRGVGWSGRWEEGSRREGHMYTYGWFVFLYDRSQHNL